MGGMGVDRRRFGFHVPARPALEQDHSYFRKVDPRRAAGFGDSRTRRRPLPSPLRIGIAGDSRHTPKKSEKTMELRGTILWLLLKVSPHGVRSVVQSGPFTSCVCPPLVLDV